jgi:hypothetical protein
MTLQAGNVARQRATAILILMLMAASLSVLGIAQASPAAAVSCTPGLGCENKDPQTTGCSADAYNLDSFVRRNAADVKVFTVELRYSPTCRTAWSRVTATTRRHIRASLVGNGISAYTIDRVGTQVWSRMRYLAGGRGYWAARAVVYHNNGVDYWDNRTGYYGIG